MNSLQNKIKALCDLYQSRRQVFLQRVTTVRTLTPWGTNKLRGKGQALLGQADRLLQEITQGSVLSVEGGVSSAVLRKRYRQLKKTYKALHEMSKPWWRQWIEAVGIALFLALFLRNFIFGLYHVPSESAETTILVGDRIWGNKMAYFFEPVKRGELVIFDDPQFKFDRSSKFHYYWQRYIGLPVPLLGLKTGPANWVKRVIATPGDTIEGRVENGRTVVYLNGQQLEEPYVNRLPLIHMQREHGLIALQSFGPFMIPDFLRISKRVVHRSFDARFSPEDQPYYKFKPEDAVLNPLTGEPIFDEAFTPTYRDYHGNIADEFGPFVVPKGKYWVMGDNRKNSGDSRMWLFLDEDLIHGRASVIIHSLDSDEAFWLFDLIKHPVDFWTKIVRWSRFGTVLKSADVK
jgi:signal peptidase I